MAKGTHTKLIQGGAIRLKSTQIRWFSWWPGGRLDLLRGGQRRWRESWKTGQLTWSENWHFDSLKKVEFSLSFQGLVTGGYHGHVKKWPWVNGWRCRCNEWEKRSISGCEAKRFRTARRNLRAVYKDNYSYPIYSWLCMPLKAAQ